MTAAVGALLVLGLAACGGGGGGAADSGDEGGGSSGGSGGGSGGGSAAEYRIIAANDLGMHCVDADFSVFSILPPYNVVNAQVIKRSPTGMPVLVGDTAVVLRYSSIADAAGSINTTSSGKTNFWRYVARLYGGRIEKTEKSASTQCMPRSLAARIRYSAAVPPPDPPPDPPLDPPPSSPESVVPPPPPPQAARPSASNAPTAAIRRSVRARIPTIVTPSAAMVLALDVATGPNQSRAPRQVPTHVGDRGRSRAETGSRTTRPA